MERIIAVNSNCYHGFRVEDAIKGIADAGFHYIELTATKGWTEHVFPDMRFSYLYSIKELCKKKNLKVIGLSGHCNLMDKNRIADFIENMKLANFFGCEYIISSIGEAHLKNNKFISDEEAASRIKGLIPYLNKYNLKLALEVHGKKHGSGAVLKKLVDMVGSEIVYINYDTANACFYGGVEPAFDIGACVDKIGYMHLKDKAGKNDEWNFPALGKGYINFPAIFNELEKTCNYCPFSIEIEFTKDGPKGIDEVNSAVKQSGEYLRTMGFVL